ncbi:polyprenyl synthetase family protein [Streptomyces sp. NPDC058157]|uniref:polyprenyl synthetase family protein n=1 Tax=Streptomyces sp. NPDC058157 TaxID=3346360 RepID=UPI0036E65037
MATAPVNGEHVEVVEVEVQDVRCRVDAMLEAFLDRKSRSGADGHLPPEIVSALRDFLAAGGKRLRPVLCVYGWRAAGAATCPDPVIQVAAALEMFHAFALIHDDLMDHTDTRRGRPTVHRVLATHHARRGRRAAEELGAGGALLIGDLALTWSDELLHTAGLAPEHLGALFPPLDQMRTEVMCGQYLDLTSTGQPSTDVEHALRIARYKTAKYTIERPLLIGATLAGADEDLLSKLSAFALPLGEAFQLRDDLLGAFGLPAQTGKPALDDLSEGKHTALVAIALKSADAIQARVLRSLYGNDQLDEQGAATLREVLKATGAEQAVEDMIRARHEQALAALGDTPIPRPVRDRLEVLAHKALWRTS